jgi:hypothetical protein
MGNVFGVILVFHPTGIGFPMAIEMARTSARAILRLRLKLKLRLRPMSKPRRRAG